MEVINTETKGWQKRMNALMQKGEEFEIVTESERLAMGLIEGVPRTGVAKLLLFGGVGVAGVTGAAKVGAASALIAVADPEPISKSVLIIIAAICAAIGAYWLYKFVCKLIEARYKFSLRSETEEMEDGTRRTKFWIYACPA